MFYPGCEGEYARLHALAERRRARRELVIAAVFLGLSLLALDKATGFLFFN